MDRAVFVPPRVLEGPLIYLMLCKPLSGRDATSVRHASRFLYWAATRSTRNSQGTNGATLPQMERIDKALFWGFMKPVRVTVMVWCLVLLPIAVLASTTIGLAVPDPSTVVIQHADESGTATQPPQAVNNFKLLVNCEPVWVIAHDPTKHTKSTTAQQLGLTPQLIQQRADSQLQQAHIFGRPGHILFLRMQFAGPMAYIDLSFNKILYDLYSQSKHIAVTWELGLTTSHRNDQEHILRQVDDLVEKFIVAYDVVNRKACPQGTLSPD